MKKLIQGIVTFRKNSIEDYRSKFSKLALQQSPDALLVACCDSRVVPNVFASSDPGDVFVLRNIGNLIPPYQNNHTIESSITAAIEFSLATLNVADIIICGHSECGAMHSLLEIHSKPHPELTSVNTWLQYAASSYQRFKNSTGNNNETLSPCNRLSRINVLQQLEHLKTYPLVNEHLQKNQLKIHGWWFDLATANVYYYNQIRDKFILINEEEAKALLASSL